MDNPADPSAIEADPQRDLLRGGGLAARKGVAALRRTRPVSMFEDRSFQRTFYSAPQSVTSLVAALLLGVDHAAIGRAKVAAFLNRSASTSDCLVPPPAGQLPLSIDTRDRVTNLGLEATWTHAPDWRIACNLGRKNRKPKACQPIKLTPHSACGASCSAQFVLQ